MKKKRELGCLVAIAAMIVISYVAFKIHGHQRIMAWVPADLDVSGIIYYEGEDWGVGPGANETYVIVYELPASVAQTMLDEGIDFFYRTENTSRREGRQRSYLKWHETPIDIDDRWGRRAGEEIRISDYLNKYGFGIPIEPDVERMVDELLSSSGSFYAWGRSGLVIVAPEARRVFFAHSG